MRKSKLRLTVYHHAYLVTGTSIIDEARPFLARERDVTVELVKTLACRPTVLNGEPCVAFYFSIGGT